MTNQHKGTNTNKQSNFQMLPHAESIDEVKQEGEVVSEKKDSIKKRANTGRVEGMTAAHQKQTPSAPPPVSSTGTINEEKRNGKVMKGGERINKMEIQCGNSEGPPGQ